MKLILYCTYSVDLRRFLCEMIFSTCYGKRKVFFVVINWDFFVVNVVEISFPYIVPKVFKVHYHYWWLFRWRFVWTSRAMKEIISMIHIDAVIHSNKADYIDGYFQNILQKVGSTVPDEAHLPDFVSRCCSVVCQVYSFYVFKTVQLCITFVSPVTPKSTRTLTLPCMVFPWFLFGH